MAVPFSFFSAIDPIVPTKDGTLKALPPMKMILEKSNPQVLPKNTAIEDKSNPADAIKKLHLTTNMAPIL